AGAVLSHATAAGLHDYPLAGDTIELTVVGTSRAVHRGLVVHRTNTLTLADRATVGPFVATSPSRTLLDLAATLDEGRLVTCVDHAVTNRVVSVDYLRRRIDALGR